MTSDDCRGFRKMEGKKLMRDYIVEVLPGGVTDEAGIKMMIFSLQLTE
ncbi:MAG: hypothetical protein R3A12_16510 [Ignavibacteria bacterium]